MSKVALISTDDLAVALGRELTLEEEDQAEYYIHLVSRYVISYTGTKFEPTTTTSRFKADYYGRIILPGPVSEVHEVLYHGAVVPWEWQWDGMVEIYGLHPNAVADVTFDHGYSEVPDDIIEVVTEAVKRIFLSPEGIDVGPLQTHKVGDVSETYRIPEGVLGGGLFNDLEKLILDEYRTTERTYRLGTHQVDHLMFPKSNEGALFE